MVETKVAPTGRRTVNLDTMAKELGARRPMAYEAAKQGELPVPSVKIGEGGMVQRLRRSLIDLDAERPVRMVCGFSGGRDSLALLAGLALLQRLGLLEVRALHVDHAVRPGSAAEARQAVEVARSLGVECDVCTVPNAAVERHGGVGLEEALRRERYRAFADVAERSGAYAVALGHHQRDQAETVLLHLLRGAGIRGASGMRVLRDLEVPWWEDAQGSNHRVVQVWRPFLAESAEAVRSFAEALGLPIVDDESNADTAFRRNAIRHQVLPVLESVNPGAVANLARFAGLAGEDSDELDHQARLALDGVEDVGILPTGWLLALPLALRRRVLLHWCRRQAGGIEISLDRIDAILRVSAVKDRERQVEIGSGWSVLVRRDELCLSPPSARADA